MFKQNTENLVSCVPRSFYGLLKTYLCKLIRIIKLKLQKVLADLIVFPEFTSCRWFYENAELFSIFNDMYLPLRKRKDLVFQCNGILSRHFAEQNCRYSLQLYPNSEAIKEIRTTPK